MGIGWDILGGCVDWSYIRQSSPVALTKTKLTTYLLDGTCSSVQVMKIQWYSKPCKASEVWRLRKMNFDFMQILKKSLLGFADAYSWILLKLTVIILYCPILLMPVKHMRVMCIDWQEKNPWGSFIVKRWIVIIAFLGNWYSCLRNYAYSLRPETEIRTASPYTIDLLVI